MNCQDSCLTKSQANIFSMCKYNTCTYGLTTESLIVPTYILDTHISGIVGQVKLAINNHLGFNGSASTCIQSPINTQPTAALYQPTILHYRWQLKDIGQFLSFRIFFSQKEWWKGVIHFSFLFFLSISVYMPTSLCFLSLLFSILERERKSWFIFNFIPYIQTYFTNLHIAAFYCFGSWSTFLNLLIIIKMYTRKNGLNISLFSYFLTQVSFS